jgi:hypothetical protein
MGYITTRKVFFMKNENKNGAVLMGDFQISCVSLTEFKLIFYSFFM